MGNALGLLIVVMVLCVGIVGIRLAVGVVLSWLVSPKRFF